jgi:phosphatidylinositol-3-phosphatase
MRVSLVLLAVVSALLFLAGCSGGSLSPTTQASASGPSSSSPNPNPSPNPGSAPPPAPSPTPQSLAVPHSSHVVLVIEENHSYTQVLSSMPWLVAQGNSYAYATDYHADEPGSALDYFWLSSGSGEKAFGCTGNGCTQPITSDNIFREVTKAGLTWKVYAESLPSVGWMGGNSGAYLDRHNPAKWYSDVINSPAMQQNMVPFTQFAKDLAANALPNYSIIVPNGNNDAHNGTLATADSWLKTNVAPLLNHPSFQAGGDGLMIVTFDECDGAVGACPELVYTAVIGPNVKRGFKSAIFYKHESALRTILDSLGISTHPGASATAPDMADFFR